MSVLDKYKPQVAKIDGRLKKLIDGAQTNAQLKEAMGYSVMAGGKRLRPLLNIMGNALLDGDVDETMDIACAMEMIHTYSLIHDDLPAMDDDDLRRGKPTSHVMFGEAVAVLAGDGLLSFAFEVMLAGAQRYPGNLAAHVAAIAEVARGAGISGMIEGQCADLENEGQILTESDLIYTHRHKTGDLIKASLLSGLLLQRPDAEQVEALAEYGYNIGLAFQIVDDTLDVTGDIEKLGKTPGKDEKEKKFTFVTMYGVEKSLKIAKEKTDRAVIALELFGSHAKDLQELALGILDREH